MQKAVGDVRASRSTRELSPAFSRGIDELKSALRTPPYTNV
jgi:hypothetical protein